MGTNPLHQEVYDMIQQDDWREILKWIKTSPMMIDLILKAPKGVMRDPLLHLLIAYDETNLALDVIAEMDTKDLRMKNFNNDTALHIAAAKGDQKVAKALLDRDVELHNMINSDGEIPLHRAALNGMKKMFYELYIPQSNLMVRRSDGATVLHCAVMGYHFELAAEIVVLAPDLIFARDQLGLTVLHHMVSIPDAFPNGCYLGVLDSLLYRCIISEKKETAHQPIRKNLSYMESMGLSDLDDMSFMFHGDTDEEMYHKVQQENPRKTSGDGARPISEMDDDEEDSHRISVAPDDDDDDDATDQIKKRKGHHDERNSRGLFDSDIDRDEKVTLFRKFSKPLEKWIKRRVYHMIKRAKYWDKLIDLRKRHDSAVELLCTIAKNKEYWLSLSRGSAPTDHHGSSLALEQRKHDKSIDKWMETPLTLAATMGLSELVKSIVLKHPASATYRGNEGKNLLHVAAESRQEKILEILELVKVQDPRVPYRLEMSKDDNSNTILHLAALANNQPSSPLQMEKEFQWFERVRRILPKDLVNHRNKDGKTAKEVFTESHEKMVEDAKNQLRGTATSCCSALVSAVTFAAGFSIANDKDQKQQNLDRRTRIVLKIFSHAYMFGLSCTAIALVQFMALLMASYEEEDFRYSLPRQYRLALATLFTAMVAMVIAFGCNTYNSLSNELSPNWENYLFVSVEILIVPFICLLVMRCGGIKFRVKKI
ncbi:hypothetical protein C5167_000785 [Papaver somniferum]|uniref:PGG domain-containing protein n=1 Tax=Papaver somniferum TaxID=3469 RepID=A0A4Y7KW73_PAPSO|nr:uncharacterized protein LOC113308503 [Papaver somniferum]RZC76642.1 hypothetical protein C5167_000785 [Papaver somniferum]